MAGLIVKLIVNAVALIAAIKLVPRVAFGGDVVQLLLLGLIFGLINSYLKPLLKLLSLPLTLFVFGLASLIINSGLILLLAVIGEQLKIPFTLAGWPTGPLSLDVLVAAVLTGIVVAVVATILQLAFARRGLLGSPI